MKPGVYLRLLNYFDIRADSSLKESAKRYREIVQNEVAGRLRGAICVALILMPLGRYLDYVKYPEYADLFFSLRIYSCGILVIILILTYFRQARAYMLWLNDLVILSLAACIATMIGVTDGSQSYYYQGITLTVIGLILANSLAFFHNVITCLFIYLCYVWATIVSPAPWVLENFLFGSFFIVSNSILVGVMTHLYSRQHRELFISHSKLQTMYDEADTLSKIDHLTQIHNRRFLVERLETRLKRSFETKIPFYLIFFDVDDFKKINDSYGHLCGDQVLVEVASAVQKMVRKESDLGRYGGDEFVFCMHDMDPKSFRDRICNIQKQINQLKIVYKKHQVAVSVSFGAVRVTPEKFASLKDLLDAADLAMLEVKRSHRGQFYLAC